MYTMNCVTSVNRQGFCPVVATKIGSHIQFKKSIWETFKENPGKPWKMIMNKMSLKNVRNVHYLLKDLS